MLKHVLLAALLLTTLSPFAQDVNFEKVAKKAEKYLAKGKFDKADKKLTKALDEAPYWGAGWDLLSEVRLNQWQQARQEDNPLANLSITVSSKDGDQEKNDSMAQSVMQLFQNFSPDKMAYNKAIYTMREAQANSKTAYMSVVYLRSYEVDKSIDTAVPDEAWILFNKAEQEFQRKNYNKSATLYQQAVEVYPQFYKASLYLGDSYYFLEFYKEAIIKFSEAVEKFPNQLEPRKYLSDAYKEAEMYELALDAAISALEVYPDLILQAKVATLARYVDKHYKVVGVNRPLLPEEAWETESTDKFSEPWKWYVIALQNIKDCVDDNGIITDCNKTAIRYSELYAWEEMLKHASPTEFLEARAMQESGYLDCYVMLTNFHQDFYSQYVDFVKHNPGRIKEYIAAQMK